MKKVFLLFVTACVISSCGLPEPKEQKIEELGISITFPGDKKPSVTPASEYSKASADFYIKKSRFEIREIEAGIIPTDLAMLEKAITANPDVKSVIAKKTLPNGAFGVTCETTKGKNFLYYARAAGRFYKITPVFNSDGKYYDEAIVAIGTIK